MSITDTIGDQKESVIAGAAIGQRTMIKKLDKVKGPLTRFDLELAYRKRVTGWQRTMSFWCIAAVIALTFIIVLTSMIDSTIASNIEKISGLLGTVLIGLLGLPLTFMGAKTILELRNPSNAGSGMSHSDNSGGFSADPLFDMPEEESKPADIRQQAKGGANDADTPAIKPPKPGEV